MLGPHHLLDWVNTVFKELQQQAIATEVFCCPTDSAEPSEERESFDAQSQEVGLSQLDTAPLHLPDPPKRKLEPSETVLRDKLGFFFGIVNLVFSTYWLAKSPETWCRWYTIKAAVLFSVRFFLYRRKKWGFYLIEFCYYANILLLVQIWVFPRSHILNKVVFGLCAGPITFSIPGLRSSLVLHSLDKTTSLFMHLTPAVMAWVERWHPNRQLLEGTQKAGWLDSLTGANSRSYSESRWWELTVLPMLAYVLWAVFYYIKVFVLSSDKIFNQNYDNMYTLMVMNSKSGLARLVLKAPKSLQPAAYLLFHCVLCFVAILVAACFWHSKLLHTTCLIACCASSAWNGATYFFDVFAHRYVDSVGLRDTKKAE